MIEVLKWLAADWWHALIGLALVAFFRPIRCSITINKGDD